jgi:hypothetical protein
MEGSRFDAWTRRSFGLAAGGLAGSLMAHATVLDVAAKKKKKKKKKCREFAESCTEKETCCCGLACRPAGMSGDACCRIGGSECSSATQCCSGRCTGGYCECKSNNGLACSQDSDCCSFKCDTGGTNKCVAT